MPARAGQTTGEVSVSVVEKLGIVKEEDLEFGKMFAGPTAGTVVVNGAGVRTKTGGVTLAGGTFHPAEFSGYGDRNQRVTVAIDIIPPVQITRAGGTQQMLVNTFTITPLSGLQNNGPAGRYKIQPNAGSTGIFSFAIGATLNVAANQMPGNYDGTFSVILNYQ
jgi:Domain of unknown function (DUF4402)